MTKKDHVHRYKFCVVFVYHWLLFGYSTCTSCSPSKSISNGRFMDGKYMESYVMKSIDKFGPGMCLRSCTRHTGCNGINYHWTHLYCELLRVTADDKMTDKEGFKYSELSSWEIETDACWPSKCKIYEQCIILTSNDPLCLPFTVDKNCKKNRLGLAYRGRLTTTKQGRTCQAWSSQTPHKHGKSLNDLHKNYCRNPDKEPDGPWCYTTDIDKRWEYCDVPYCDE